MPWRLGIRKGQIGADLQKEMLLTQKMVCLREENLIKTFGKQIKQKLHSNYNTFFLFSLYMYSCHLWFEPWLKYLRTIILFKLVLNLISCYLNFGANTNTHQSSPSTKANKVILLALNTLQESEQIFLGNSLPKLASSAGQEEGGNRMGHQPEQHS